MKGESDEERKNYLFSLFVDSTFYWLILCYFYFPIYDLFLCWCGLNVSIYFVATQMLELSNYQLEVLLINQVLFFAFTIFSTYVDIGCSWTRIELITLISDSCTKHALKTSQYGMLGITDEMTRISHFYGLWLKPHLIIKLPKAIYCNLYEYT